MVSGAKSKSATGDGGEATKRRRVGFPAVVAPVSCSANECLKLHIAGQELQDEDGEYTFSPEFAERVFGEDGKIYGYQDLKIDLWLHASSFHAYVQIQYTSKSAGGKKAPCTDVLAKLKEVFGDAVTDDRETFQRSLLDYSNEFQDTVVRNGEFVLSWRSEASSSALVTEENTIAASDIESRGTLRQIVRVELVDTFLRGWHSRLTPLSLFFIESAQGIESDDPLWEVYLALEGEGAEMRVAGFCNVYRFYHYPDSTRLRISQVLVLPPYQGHGFGLRLLEAVNTAAIARGCYDVTMEEPSMALQKLRDTMDVLRLLSLPSLDEAIKDALRKLQVKKDSVLSKNGSEVLGDESGALVNFNGNTLESPSQKSNQVLKEKSVLLPPAYLIGEVRKKLKISKMQFKRCWEQLLFMYLDTKDRDIQDVFQEALVQRLNSEIFDKDNGSKTAGKRVVDIENEHDNTKTFIMMRRRKKDPVDGNGSSAPDEEADVPGDEAQALIPGPEEKGKVLQEELKEREDEMLSVAQAVARHCRTLGFNIPSMKIWEQVAREPSEVVT